MAMLDVVEYISKSIDEDRYTVNHSVFRGNLHIYGIRSIASTLFSNNLRNRCHQVVVDGTFSYMAFLTCGVFRGSFLFRNYFFCTECGTIMLVIAQINCEMLILVI